MPALKYASRAELQDAISKRRLIQFTHKSGTRSSELRAEPHWLDHAAKSGTLVLLAWVPTAEGAGEWQNFRFCEIRNLLVTAEPFMRRPMPDFFARCFDPFFRKAAVPATPKKKLETAP